MRHFKKLTKVIVMMVMLALVIPVAFPMSNKTVVQAASSLKINKKSLTLVVGKSETLTIKGAKKVSWSSSDKKVATVSKTGKVTAIAAGKTKITATVNKKKYSCTVKVVEAENKALKEAPFGAKEEKLGKIKVVIPKDWTSASAGNGTVSAYTITPPSVDVTKGSSVISVTIQNKGTAAPDYATVTKPYLTELITANLITTQLRQAGMDAVVSDFKTSDYAAKPGMAFKTEYKCDYKTTISTGTFKQVIYDLYVGTYLIEIQIVDKGTAVTPDVYQVGEYLLNSIQITK